MANTKKNKKGRRSIPSISDIIGPDTASYSLSNQSQASNAEDEWLLRKLREELSPSPNRPSNSTTTLTCRPYEREEVMYKTILENNIAKLNTSIPAPKPIYQTPIWYQGKWICLVDEFDRSFSSYLRELNKQFYQDSVFFRCVVTSFWGPAVASVFEVISSRRPYIQVSFREGWEYATRQDKYAEAVEMFAYAMGRLRLIEGGAQPITKIFGFKFVDYWGNVISAFETRERAMKDDAYDASDRLIIMHRWSPFKGTSINVGDD
ncbi:hypothetical protein F4820DRAFT_452814 [Hypoxylon rubiginosum]|uniref:Uncharacterized protein n=1 Tax=Hypoxylon rubiginosum TaxID=110542 RepID=A0ACB9YMY7_9PEZI|nr:hypothetical protein F4820DRAFT_452814 [Hypoxylon rubiginosum]